MYYASYLKMHVKRVLSYPPIRRALNSNGSWRSNITVTVCRRQIAAIRPLVRKRISIDKKLYSHCTTTKMFILRYFLLICYLLFKNFCFILKFIGSEMDDDEMVVSESEDSNDSWTTEEFSSEFIMRYGSR